MDWMRLFRNTQQSLYRSLCRQLQRLAVLASLLCCVSLVQARQVVIMLSVADEDKVAMPADTTRQASAEPDYSFYDRYPFIIVINANDDVGLVEFSDDDFIDKAGKVVFRVNRYDAFTNDSLLQLLDEVVLPQINRDSLRLRRLVVRGAASMEGPVANNRMLGVRRMETLANFLRARISVPVDEDNFTTEAVTEDYRLLLVLMRRADDPDYETVKFLCDQYLPAGDFQQLKTRLQRVQGGRLWARLLQTYFPELRAARLVLFLEKPSQKPALTGLSEVSVLPETTEQAELPDTLQRLDLPELPIVLETPEEIVLPRRELLSVKSNLLLDFAYMPGYDRWCPIPNVAVEYYPKKGHFTYGASFDCPWWQHYWDHKFFQIRNYQLETRYYLRSGSVPDGSLAGEKVPAFGGLYFSGYAHAAIYGICFGERRGWVGEGAGAGLGLGYVMPISRNGHWRLEFSAQVGIFLTKYDPYQYENPVNPYYRDHLYYYKWTGDPDLFRERQYRFTWVGPTRVGITLSYDLLYRRIQKKGASFEKTEKTYPLPLPVMEGSIYTNSQK